MHHNSHSAHWWPGRYTAFAFVSRSLIKTYFKPAPLPSSAMCRQWRCRCLSFTVNIDYDCSRREKVLFSTHCSRRFVGCVCVFADHSWCLLWWDMLFTRLHGIACSLWFVWQLMPSRHICLTSEALEYETQKKFMFNKCATISRFWSKFMLWVKMNWAYWMGNEHAMKQATKCVGTILSDLENNHRERDVALLRCCNHSTECCWSSDNGQWTTYV